MSRGGELITLLHSTTCGELTERWMLQIMGMMQGKVMGDTFIVVDTFALPVEGTETRVNAAEGAYPYMISFLEASKVCPPKPRMRTDAIYEQRILQ